MIQKMLYFSLQDQREQYFKPYLYGPYSEFVGWAIQSLLTNDYLTLADNTIAVKPGLHYTIDEPYKQTIDSIVALLTKYNLKTAAAMAMFAKIHMFTVDNPTMQPHDLKILIKEQSPYLGWKQLQSLSDTELDTYIAYAKEMETSLASASPN